MGPPGTDRRGQGGGAHERGARLAPPPSPRMQDPQGRERDPQESSAFLRPGDRSPVMKFTLIDEEKTHHPVSRMAGVLGVSRAGYHSWEKRAPSDRRTADEQLKVRISEIHAASFGIYGAPRVHAELADTYGINIGRKRVARLMREMGIEGVSRRGKRKAKKSTSEMPAAPDLVKRDFTAERPNELWV